jgi:hypothetical protein
MNDISPPVQSLTTLLISSLCALIIAAIVLLVAVLPAEFGKDPTGLGKAMGLLVLSTPQTMQQLPVEAASIQPTDIQTSVLSEPVAKAKEIETAKIEPSAAPILKDKSRYRKNDMVTLVIPAGKGLEYKFHLNKGETLQYHWKTDADKLYFDFHGEPQGDTTGFFKSFLVKTENQSQGNFIAPFSGIHGWYWENRYKHPVKVILVTSGEYDIIGKIGVN